MNLIKNEDILFNASKIKLFFLLFFVLLIVCSFRIIPYDDSYYYWDWGRHLALSYFDGPPLIAYLMRLFSLLFGNTTYAINFLGVTTIYLTLFFIYRTGKLLFGERIALNACLLWLLSPLVIHFLFLWVTYDNPFNLLWAMTIYFTVKYTQQRKNVDLYCIGCSIGLLFLAKYTAVVLVIALFLFMVSVPQYRSLFRNRHFYFAMLAAIVIASPVFIWNYQHHWISFTYQMSDHQSTAVWRNLSMFVTRVLVDYNILLFLPLYALYKTAKTEKQPDAILLLNIISFTFLAFFLYLTFKNNLSTHWLAPFYISSTLTGSYYFAKFNLRKLFLITISLYFIAVLHLLIVYSAFQKDVDGNMSNYALAKNAGEKYWRPDTIVLTSYWENAAQMLFWLPGKPNIYTLPCGLENQYAIWSQPIVQQIRQKQIKTALYLDFIDRSSCIKPYFTHCQPLPTLTYINPHYRFNRTKQQQLFAYRCTT